MDPQYAIGIPEIDAQHEQISKLVQALREAIGERDQRHLIHSTLKRLHQLLVTHFEYEDSFMAMVNYEDSPQHKKSIRAS